MQAIRIIREINMQKVENLTALAEQQIGQLFACTDSQKLSLLHFEKNQLLFQSKQPPAQYFVQTHVTQQFPVCKSETQL